MGCELPCRKAWQGRELVSPANSPMSELGKGTPHPELILKMITTAFMRDIESKDPAKPHLAS